MNLEKSLVVFLMLLLGRPAYGQIPPPYQLSNSLDLQEQEELGKLNDSRLAYHYTYIGQTEKAYQTYELPLVWELDTLDHVHKAELATYQPVDAADYITTNAPKNGVVIIGEAHQRAEHRVFTKSLLQGLYDQGYRYLGIEAVTPHIFDTTLFIMDTLLQERGYTLYSPVSGSYVREPQMSRMIREAITIGFEIFGYDYHSREPERDLHQAMRIKKFIKERPPAGTLIHCGWYHAVESDFKKRTKDHYMAYHLKQLMGMDPMTVYLDALNEKYITPSSPYYSTISYDRPTILIKHNGRPFGGFNGHQHFDALVYSPPVDYKYGRPSWLYDDGLEFIAINQAYLKDSSYPVLVAAYYDGEEDGTPLDVIELSGPMDDTRLLLPVGERDIIVKLRDHKKIDQSFVLKK